MADVRALLKAKRQEARITHPYASYNASGQLKCAVCESIVKYASAWEGHLGSKGHRTNLARIRAEEHRQREQEEAAALEAATAKRKAPVEEPEPHAEKKRKVEEQSQGAQSASSSSFPQDFFSDPSRAPALLSDDSDEEEGEDQTSPTQPPPSAKPDTVVDLEYERFQRDLLAISADPTEAYDRATVAAEPVPASTNIEGFPTEAPEVAAAPEPELTEAEVRAKKEQEERELIMDRLLEEERAQEEADNRVQLFKTKIEVLKRKRELAKANKAKTTN